MQQLYADAVMSFFVFLTLSTEAFSCFVQPYEINLFSKSFAILELLNA